MNLIEKKIKFERKNKWTEPRLFSKIKQYWKWLIQKKKRNKTWSETKNKKKIRER